MLFSTNNCMRQNKEQTRYVETAKTVSSSVGTQLIWFTLERLLNTSVGVINHFVFVCLPF
jgi:hypothetical protein